MYKYDYIQYLNNNLPLKMLFLGHTVIKKSINIAGVVSDKNLENYIYIRKLNLK